MYLEHFNLTRMPFSLSPDPGFLLLCRDHREALAHLLYGLKVSGGFVQITGEVGTGKTTLCHYLIGKMPEDIDIALILNPRQTALELVAAICDELGVDYPPEVNSIKLLVDRLNEYLLENHGKGRKTLLIIDEAQNLSPDVLEQIRLLTNLETPSSKLLQIFLIGQPELKTMMARPDLRQLDQRITARYHLAPLSKEETYSYIDHRMTVSGAGKQPFTAAAKQAVFDLSGGLPRLINIICDRALLGAYSQNRHTVDSKIVKTAYREIRGETPQRRRGVAHAGYAALLVLLAVGFAAGFMMQSELGDLLAFHRSKPAPKEDHQTATVVMDGIQPAMAVTDGIEPAVAREAPPDGDSLPANSRGTRLSEQTAMAIARRNVDEPQNAGFPDTVGTVSRGIPGLMDEASSEPEPPPFLDLSALAQDGALPVREEDAFDKLLRLWGVEDGLSAGVSGCIRALAAGLQCISQTGTLADLLSYNRPAILEISTREQILHHVVLVGATDTDLVVDASGNSGQVAVADLVSAWTGRFTLLWRPPPLTRTVLSQGMSGTDILWLRNRLAMIPDIPATSPDGLRNPDFDEDLKEQVLAFQRTHRIPADGLVGRRTLIELNSAVADPRVPKLFEPATAEPGP